MNTKFSASSHEKAARATKEDGRRFALSNKGWIQERLAHMPAPLPFLHGVSIPFLGVEHRIRHRIGKRGAVWREAGDIHVAGRPEHLPRRVEDWLKHEARREIEERGLTSATSTTFRYGYAPAAGVSRVALGNATSIVETPRPGSA